MSDIELDDAAMQMADMAFLNTTGTSAVRVRVAVEAYLWSVQNALRSTGTVPGSTDHEFITYPSYNEWLRFRQERVL